MRVCFVCSGNICRSPTAEVVLRARLARAGITDVEVDSAGTGDWHAGQDMDERARTTLERAGYRPNLHVAKQFTARDFAHRDLVLALDETHWRHLTELAAGADDPDAARSSVVLVRSYDQAAVTSGELDVADPYYGDDAAFAEVLRQVEQASDGLIEQLSAR